MQTALLTLALQLSRWPATTPLTVDGRLDEAFWQSAPAITDFHQVLPEAGTPTAATRVVIAVDERYFYVGAAMLDPPGSARLSNVSRRDHIPASDDTLSLTLDPLGTRALGQVFQVNPDCSTNDGFYKEATLVTDYSADFDFEAACHKTDEGWSVELKIPLEELRFDQNSRKPWNILVQRHFVRDMRYSLANAPLPRDPLCLLCLAPSLDRQEALPPQTFLRVTPYALWRHTDQDTASRGVDIKYRLDSSSYVDATINPDFSQVNLDEPQLSANTRFALSSPENRPFFLEGADILETPLKTMSTRSIVQPSWGMKYTRRLDGQDTMLLTGDDRSANRILIPGPYRSRYQTINARQKYWIGSTQWKNEDTQFGLSYTHRSYDEQGSNQTLGLTALHLFSREDSLRWQAILSRSDDTWNPEPHHESIGSAGFLLFQHKGEVWHSSLELKSLGADFRSDLGFNPRNDYRLGILTQKLHQDLGSTHIVYYLRMTQKTELSQRPMQIQNAPGLTLSGWLGAELTLETRPETQERIREDGALHRYQQHMASLGLYPGSVVTWVQCDLTFGERLDVTDDRVRPGRAESCAVRLALGPRIEWNASFSQEKLLTEDAWNDKDPILVNRVARHLLVFPLTTRFSLRYIRQEERTKRMEAAREHTEIDSLNLSYENTETLTLHAGATHSKGDAATQRDYYLKVSARLP
ncbi:MAG TPA: DUF5916 domain-containing protein [Oligoflexus sp.]|uniref:carbohydrate binding family 9 domain-containing protein n=1 Tax=Oligoflexus sp. TaxID=1971216 RepID=UPI002D801934|nr:DUF5916 domain-containing protein [Oligoflexus sp.]HET9240781.1 DUF5916 domain-containing protein [Oligoflexus sp.]